MADRTDDSVCTICERDDFKSSRALSVHVARSHPQQARPHKRSLPGYRNWEAMVRRTTEGSLAQKRKPTYADVDCDPRWTESYDAFWDDMSRGWFEGAQLDRIDPDQGYWPHNCQWLSAADHARKTHEDNDHLLVTSWGEPAVDVARRNGVGRTVLYGRINRYGWHVDRACTAPVRVNTPLTRQDIPDIRQRLANGDTQSAIADDYGVSQKTIYNIKHGESWSDA